MVSRRLSTSTDVSSSLMTSQFDPIIDDNFISLTLSLFRLLEIEQIQYTLIQFLRIITLKVINNIINNNNH